MISVEFHDVGRLLDSLSIDVPESYRGHSGHLPTARPFSMSLASDIENHFWMCVAVRTGSARLTVSYVESTDVVFDIWPGAPLVLPTSSFPPSGFSLAALEEGTFVEAVFFESDIPLEAQPPAGAFLVLNAADGIRLGAFEERGQVKGWTDIRPESGAPSEFTLFSSITGGGANFVAEDPDFAGKPSVEWTAPNAGGYRYATETSGLWDFLGAGGEFLFMAIMKPPADRGNQSLFWNRADAGYPGLYFAIDGGYRMTARLFDDEVSAVVDETEVDEIIEGGAMVVILALSSTGLRLYRQGGWDLLSGPASGNSAATLSRPLLGLASLGEEIELGLKITDLRIWNSIPENADDLIADYIEWAVEEHGVDDSERQGYPWVTGAYGFLRANRGYERDDQHVFDTETGEFTEEFAIDQWNDTRNETTAPPFEQDGLKEQPGWSDAGLNGNPAIRPYGVNLVGETYEVQHLTAAAIWTPVDNQDAFTMTMVFETVASVNGLAGGTLFSTKDGPVATGAGTIVWLVGGIDADEEDYRKLRVVMNDASVGGLVDEMLGYPPCAPGATMAMCLRFDPDGARCHIDLMNVDTNVRRSVFAETDGWTPATNADPPTLFRSLTYYDGWTAFEGYMGELGVIPGYADDDDVDRFFAYTARRYGP